MLLVKESVKRVVVLCWIALWFASVGLNDWRLTIEAPASLATASLACFIVAGVTLATLVSDRARRTLCEPDMNVGRVWLHLSVFFAGFTYAGLSILVSAIARL